MNLGKSLMEPVMKRAKMKSNLLEKVHSSSRSSTKKDELGGTLHYWVSVNLVGALPATLDYPRLTMEAGWD